MPEIKTTAQYLLKVDKSLKDAGFLEAKRRRQSFNQYLITLLENDLKKSRRQ